MANYGIPYMGSKDGIADLICNFLPGADNFYDLFGGGFSITQCMIQEHPDKYKNFFFNEVNADTVGLIKDSINGKYNYDNFKPEFIDRETFFKNKDSCAYTRIVWSFGNNQRSYIFGKEIEADKKSLHNAVVFNVFDDNAVKLLGIKKFQKKQCIKKRRLVSRRILVAKQKRCDLQQLEQLERLQQLEQLQRLERLEQLQRLERLERLEQLQRLERLERLEFSTKSYHEIEIKPNSIIYCDPPYIGTAEYLKEFDHKRFYSWAMDCTYPVFISEYKMPSCFDIAFSISKKCNLSAIGATDSCEKLFVNKAAKDLLNSQNIKTYSNKG